MAVKEQNIDCVTVLLGDIDVNVSNDQTNIKILNIDATNNNGFTPYHLAVANNNLAICKMLEEKASIDGISLWNRVEKKKGDTVLHIAVAHQSLDVLRYLLKNKAIDVNKQNFSGHTALYLARAIERSNSDDIVHLLMQNNAIENIDTEVSNERESDSLPISEPTTSENQHSLKVCLTELIKVLFVNLSYCLGIEFLSI